MITEIKRVLFKAWNSDGLLGSAKVQDSRKRVFEYSRRFGVTQFVEHPVSNANGYGDGYWRRAGKRDAEAVERFLTENKLIETRHQKDARIAKEAIGF